MKMSHEPHRLKFRHVVNFVFTPNQYFQNLQHDRNSAIHPIYFWRSIKTFHVDNSYHILIVPLKELLV